MFDKKKNKHNSVLDWYALIHTRLFFFVMKRLAVALALLEASETQRIESISSQSEI